MAQGSFWQAAWKWGRQALGIAAPLVIKYIQDHKDEIYVWSNKALQNFWQNRFESDAILILGEAGTGKTSLDYYMRFGHPYEEVNGERFPPNPTLGEHSIAFVGHKHKVKLKRAGSTENVTLNLQRDLPGDDNFRYSWAEALEQISPTGIIYMLDGNLSGDRLEAAIHTLFDDVLMHFRNGLGNLRALALFVNRADEWRPQPPEDKLITIEKTAEITRCFETLRAQHSSLATLALLVKPLQLSPHEDQWNEAKFAIEDFAMELARKRSADE